MTEVDPTKRPSAKELLKELGEEVLMASGASGGNSGQCASILS